MNRLKWDRIPVPIKPMTKKVKKNLDNWVVSEPKHSSGWSGQEYSMQDTIRFGKYKDKLTLEQIKEHNPVYLDRLLMNNDIILIGGD